MNSDITNFRAILSKSRNLIIITGAGISAESGVPTFRGSGGLWRDYRSQDLATLYAFHDNPGLVWEFYHYRRELVLKTKPNAGHNALSTAEKLFTDAKRNFTIITQNVDGLHLAAGNKNILELHGNLFKTRCTICDDVRENWDSPICNALGGREIYNVQINALLRSPKFDPEVHKNIHEKDLPRCKKLRKRSDLDSFCNGLLRPHIVWFGENLDQRVLSDVDAVTSWAGACLVVGTSSVVYPAAGLAPKMASWGVPVAEVNLEATPSTDSFAFSFQGQAGEILPQLFDSLELT